MGSGAFLVQVCRWLSERLVEAWAIEEQKGKFIDSEGRVHDRSDSREPLRPDIEERLITARRLIAERCLYGVDINPLAVELAKLSIWLVTLAKGRPFGFLDHNLRSGNSLLGITDIKQIMHLHIDPKRGEKIHQGLFNKYKKIERVLNDALEKRRTLRTISILDIEDVRRMKLLDNDAHELLKVPELVADVVVGEALAADSEQKLDERMKIRAMEAASHVEGDLTARQVLEYEAHNCLNIDKPLSTPERKPFHWVLEYPEVFMRENKGFDVVLGNPPFLGGKSISGAMGKLFRDFLVIYLANGKKGNADLVTYFFLRAYQLLGKGKVLGLLATNTIAEGDTRQVGLETILAEMGGTIYSAYPSEVWPGKAAIVTSRIHMIKGPWKGDIFLNGSLVEHISAFLSSRNEWSLQRLSENSNIAYQGSITLGAGFELDETEARNMIAHDPRNNEVLFPYLNGNDLNTHPTQKASRWIISFFDWPEDKVKQYQEPYQIVQQKVKPERLAKKDKNISNYPWWQHWRPRAALYHAIGRGYSFVKHPKNWKQDHIVQEHVLVSCRVTKYMMFTFVPNNMIYTLDCNVFSLDHYFDFAILQSSLHDTFVWKHASKMKNDGLRYTPTDAFQPFPRPYLSGQYAERLEKLGNMYHTLRAEIMNERQEGLTKLYNRFHDLENDDDLITSMRKLHRQIDEAVALSYGWGDLDLEHDFYEVDYRPKNDRLRFTLSQAAQNEILDRLALLNKERYEEEKNESTSKNKSPKNKTHKKQKTNQDPQHSLFGEGDL